jgi:hypothetical protein
VFRLHFIGTHHYNPRHRRLVTQAYDHLVQTDHGGDKPRFIAVEASSEQFDHIRDVERPAVLKLVEAEWPQAPKSMREMLAVSMLFEADAHLDSALANVRDAPIIWLDDGDDRDPNGLGAKWVNVLRQRVVEQPLDKKDQSDLEAKIAIACTAIDKAMEGSDDKKERDIKFTYRLLGAVAPQDDGWAIVTVGKLHAADVCDRMHRLLNNAGFDCVNWFPLV